MPNYAEKIPGPNINLQFPGGDIESRYIDAANILYCRLTTGERVEKATKISRLRDQEAGRWRSMMGQETVHTDMQYLADRWGHTLWPEDDLGMALATMGMFSTMGFIQKSKLLPISNLRPFSETTAQMSNYGKVAIEFFASEAWQGMHDTHPAVHSVMAPWVGHIAETFQIDQQDRLTLLNATAVMPYIMSVATRMDGYFNLNIDRQLSDITKNQS